MGNQGVYVSCVNVLKSLALVEGELELAIVEGIGEIEEIEDSPTIGFEHVVRGGCARVWNLTFDNHVGVRMRLNMFDLMTNVINESVSIGHLGVSLCILDRQLSIVRQGSAVVVCSIDYLHLSKLSWNSSTNIKEY